MHTQWYSFCVVAIAVEEDECCGSACGGVFCFADVGFWWGHVEQQVVDRVCFLLQ